METYTLFFLTDIFSPVLNSDDLCVVLNLGYCENFIIVANFCTKSATPGFVAPSGSSNFKIAGSVLLYSTTLKNSKPLSAELNPSPVVPLLIFSTKIFSPATNWGVANPLIGVFNVHVTIPLLLLWILVTRYPFVLLIVLRIWGLEVNPLGDSKISTEDTEFADNFNCITPWSAVNLPVSGSTITRSGTEE